MNLRSFSTLQLTLGISIALHAMLLTVRFVDPEAFSRVFEDTPLKVILVNANIDQKPDKARAMAQADMAGGGNAATGRATSPLPHAMVSIPGEVSEQEHQRERQKQQPVVLSSGKTALVALPPTDPLTDANTPEDVQREQKRRQLTELLAEIERRIQMDNAGPKKRFIGPATREAIDATYHHRLRRAIEDQGTANFPEQGGSKLYGELTMVITINHDGRVLSTEVVQGSGNRLLDRRAQAIAKAAGPFGAFNPDMRRQAEQIAVVSRFNFTRDDTLDTRPNAP